MNELLKLSLRLKIRTSLLLYFNTEFEWESQFDSFWAELSSFLEEINPAVDDRRHGETLHMPIAVSIRHLREVIEERLQLTRFPDEKKPFHLKNE